MRRSFRVVSRFFVMVFILSLAVVSVAFFMLLNRYPWNIVSKEFGSVDHLSLLSDWPINPMIEELHKKKKKRLPKAEMQRLFDLDIRRMSFIHIPVMDLFSSSQVKHISADAEFRAVGFSEFPWPWMETSRALGDGFGPQKVSYVTLPSPRGLRLLEGVLLAPGEELEFAFPITKIRRAMRFFVVPMNTGTLRVNLGQTSWARTFEDVELGKPMFVSIPINDTATALGRISASSSKVFIVGVKIAQSEMSGRQPILVPSRSSLWTANPEFLKAPEKDMALVPDAADANEDAGVETPQNSADVKAGEEASEAEAVPLAESSVPSAPVQTPVPAGETAPPTNSKDGLLDSIKVDGNPQIVAFQGKTLALGYNLLVIHAGEIPHEVLLDEKKFAKYAPAISALMNSSVQFEVQAQEPARSFRTLILGEGLPTFRSDLPVILRDAVAQMEPVNLYRHFRDYGYHVWSAAPASFLGFSRELAWTSGASVFADRWLDANDWNLAKKRIRIDRDAQPVQGLEAVFQSKDVSLQPPLVTSDYSSVSKYFSKVAANSEAFPDWQANELFLPDDRDSYTSAVLNHVQSWIDANRQIRFLGHLWLGGASYSERPSLKDFGRVLKAGKIGGAVTELWSGNLAKIALGDRAWSQLDDALHVRRLAHRTIIMMIIPHGKSSRVLLKVPGVLPARKNGVSSEISVDDLRATALGVLGLPLQSQSKQGDVLIRGVSQEQVDGEGSVQSTNAAFALHSRLERFILRISVGKNKCAPFWWRSRNTVVHIESSAPVVEVAPNRMEFKVYPCSVKRKTVSIDWYQRSDAFSFLPGETPRESILRRLGGEFVFEDPAAERPEFLFGEWALKATHPAFSFTNPSPDDLNFLMTRPWTQDAGEQLRSEKRLDAARSSNFSSGGKNSTFVLFARENPLRN